MGPINCGYMQRTSEKAGSRAHAHGFLGILQCRFWELGFRVLASGFRGIYLDRSCPRLRKGDYSTYIFGSREHLGTRVGR